MPLAIKRLKAYSCSPLNFSNCFPPERTHLFADFIAKFAVLNPVYFSATEVYVRRPYQGKDHAGSQALHCSRGIPHFARFATIKYCSRLIISHKFGTSTIGLTCLLKELMATVAIPNRQLKSQWKSFQDGLTISTSFRWGDNHQTFETAHLLRCLTEALSEKQYNCIKYICNHA